MEALTNVAKYASATAADVTMQQINGHVVIDVADDGVGGADPAAGTGLAASPTASPPWVAGSRSRARPAAAPSCGPSCPQNSPNARPDRHLSPTTRTSHTRGKIGRLARDAVDTQAAARRCQPLSALPRRRSAGRERGLSDGATAFRSERLKRPPRDDRVGRPARASAARACTPASARGSGRPQAAPGAHAGRALQERPRARDRCH